MKFKLLTGVSTTEHPGFKKLEASLKLFNYDYEVLVNPSMDWNWGGWSMFAEWCRKEMNKPDGYTHVVITDGFDTLALGPMEEVIEGYKKICPAMDCFVYSTEKQYFPNSSEDPNFPKKEEYPETPENQRWKFINGGQYMAPVAKLVEMWEQAEKNINSQHWAHKKFLWFNQDKKVIIDNNCDIFQSVAFTTWEYPDGRIEGGIHNSLGEFSVVEPEQLWDDTSQTPTYKNGYSNKRLLNNYTKTKAPLAHGNGRADFQFVYDILGL